MALLKSPFNMFYLQESPIDYHTLKNSYHKKEIGAFVSFEGLIRNDMKGNQEVCSLFYKADEENVNAEGLLIVEEALRQFNLSHAICVQRIGQVKVTELATWIGVWSAHRNEAFLGCRYIIEESKKRLLIWKKEFYTDGTSTWIHGQQSPVII